MTALSDTDRRVLIGEAALDVAAERGARALTHRAVDVRLGLPVGSTSFYFRTRKELLRAAVTRLALRARADFEEAEEEQEPPSDVEDAALRIASLLDHMVGPRRRDTLARYALVVEVADEPELRAALARAAFSVPLAADLLTTLGASEPRAGADLVAFTEGLVFDRVAGNGALDAPEPGSAESVGRFADAVAIFLRGAVEPSPR
ncbi:TetR/AcrR family transcriptional regulator [Saccharomonospora xinjiangensis]|uniref:TetR/AcrR family transcriptional regulator n=1 Tax=Saccharomonospora xinjiangensis TaxID=75294 RepID=UPI0039EA2871